MINLKQLIRDAHQQGEWWIDNAGEISPISKEGEPLKDTMKALGWKVMRASADKIEIDTWKLRAEDLKMIVEGIKAILNKDPDVDVLKDKDDAVGEDDYRGPRVDLTIISKKKQFKNVPLGVLEKCLPSRIKNYEKGKDTDLAGPEELQEGYHYSHKEYRLYEARNHIVAIFEDNSRLVFEVHFHDNRGEDREKWRHKAFTKWKSLANEIYRDVQLTEAGNPIQRSWRESFEEALKDERMKEFIRTEEHNSIFPR